MTTDLDWALRVLLRADELHGTTMHLANGRSPHTDIVAWNAYTRCWVVLSGTDDSIPSWAELGPTAAMGIEGFDEGVAFFANQYGIAS